MSEPVTHGTALGHLIETAAGPMRGPADATHLQREPLPRGSQCPARSPGDLGGLGVTPAPCPVCGLGDGFHDHGWPGSRHDAYEVPRDLVLPPAEESRQQRDVHRPYDDDGVAYCGWFSGNDIYDGCGEVWPCTTVRAKRAERGGAS